MESLIAMDLAKDIGSITTIVFTITQAFKMAGLPSKYAPIVAIVSGVGISFLLGVSPAFGLLGGLSASGLYSQIKATTKTEIKTIDPVSSPINSNTHID